MLGGEVKSGARVYMNLLGNFLDMFNLAGASFRIPDQEGILSAAAKVMKHDNPIIDGIEKAEKNGRAWQASTFGLADNSLVGKGINTLGTAINMPTKLLATADEIFKQVNYRAYLRENAFQEAAARGLEGNSDALAKFVTDYMRDGFDAAGRGTDEAALQMARKATFTTELGEGTIGRWIQEGVQKHPELRPIIPFVRVPLNIFKTTFEYTPGINLLMKDFRRELFHADPLVRAGARGRFVLGGAFCTLAYTWAANGRITGGGPGDPEEKKALMATGWRPYSLVFKGDDGKNEYVQFGRIEPIGTILGVLADYKDAERNMPEADGAALGTAVAISVAKNALSKTYLRGLADFTAMISQPDFKAKQFWQSRFASYVPALTGQVVLPDEMKELRTVMDGVRSRIPGLSDSLPPKRDVFGDKISPLDRALPGASGTDLARRISPVVYGKETTDPVKLELAQLKYPFKEASPRLGNFDLRLFKTGEGRDAYDRYQELAGTTTIGGKTLHEALQHLITSDRYQRLQAPTNGEDVVENSKNPRIQEVQRLLFKYRDRAADQLRKETPTLSAAEKDLKMRITAARKPTPILQRLAAR
jgi:hypothetical protein